MKKLITIILLLILFSCGIKRQITVDNIIDGKVVTKEGDTLNSSHRQTWTMSKNDVFNIRQSKKGKITFVEKIK